MMTTIDVARETSVTGRIDAAEGFWWSGARFGRRALARTPAAEAAGAPLPGMLVHGARFSCLRATTTETSYRQPEVGLVAKSQRHASVMSKEEDFHESHDRFVVYRHSAPRLDHACGGRRLLRARIPVL